MELPIEKWGNSAAIRLPSALLSELGVALGDTLSVQMQPEGLVLRPVRRRYSLADLMERCDLSASPPADMLGWNTASPAGNEIK
ncbi:MAG: AbrB/MazE/SpoVT family DNA-binding domain-containing protein [Candidatus Binatia bacterium]